MPLEFLADRLENVRELLTILETIEPMDEPYEDL